MDIKITIVTISYNQAAFLGRTIKSVVDQNYQDIEYIVVDPGSTDGSRDIINRYYSQISKVIYEPDKGAADGLNKGFRFATGDIYGFINSDDIYLPGAFRKIADYFQNHPKVDVASGHAIVIDENDREIRKSYSDKFDLRRHAYGASILMQPSTFFRASCFSPTKGFNVENRSNWDAEFFVDMLLSKTRFARINDFLSGYRLHRESITATGKIDVLIRNYDSYIFKKMG